MATTSQSRMDDQVQEIRNKLEEEGLLEGRKLTGSYIFSVLSQPNRSPERAYQKIKKSLQWRRDFAVEKLDPNEFREQLLCNSIYWYGFDKDGHPILWVSPSRKNIHHLEVEKELKMNVWILEEGLKRMPVGIDSFTIINNSDGMGMTDFNYSTIKAFADMMAQGYPDRLHALYVGPVGFVVNLLSKAATYAFPKSFGEKMVIMRNPKSQLKDVLDEDLIPDFFGGTYSHPDFVKAAAQQEEGEHPPPQTHQQDHQPEHQPDHQPAHPDYPDHHDHHDHHDHPDHPDHPDRHHHHHHHHHHKHHKEEEDQENVFSQLEYDWERMLSLMERGQ